MRMAMVGCAVVVISICSAQPLLTAYRTPTPPALDGVLDESCWTGASVTSPFISATGPGMPGEQTVARVCWDADHLYVGVEAFEGFLASALNMLHAVRAERNGEDAAVFSDDCIEVFLDPPGEHDYHFAANSATGAWDARNQQAEWDSGWGCVARRGTKSYVVEMAIPFAALSATPEGPWRINICRERTAVEELSTWSGVRGAFYQPEAFGLLAFAETGPALGGIAVEARDAGYAVTGEIVGAADDATILEVGFTAGDRTISANAAGPGTHTLNPALPAGAAEAGSLQVSYTLKQGDAVVARSPAMTYLLGALTGRLTVAAEHAEVAAYVNGRQVPTAAETDVPLEQGMNVLTLSARATGDTPRIEPSVSAAGRTLSIRWLCRTDEPAVEWRTSLPGAGWSAAEAPGTGLWPAKGAREAHFICAVHVGKPEPQLFPKMDTYYFPRGSKQLIRVYVHAPASAPADSYRMVVELPSELAFIDAEPVSGGTPVVEGVGTRRDGEHELTQWAIGYEMLPRPGMDLSMRWGGAGEENLGYQTALAAGGTFDWRRLSKEITPPGGAQNVRPLVIKWQNRGIVGTFWVDNVVLREKGSDVNLLARGTLDDPERGKHSSIQPEGPDGSMCVKIVSKPEAADKQQAVWVEDAIAIDPGKTYIVEMDVKCEGLTAPNARPVCGLLMEAPADMAEGSYPIYTYFLDMHGTMTEVPRRSTLEVLPPLKNVRPSRARISPCYYASSLVSEAVGKAYAENCRASGITWTYGQIGNNVVEHLMPDGHKVFWSIGWHPYSAPSGQRDFIEAHPELQAVDFQGKAQASTFCPTWLLSEGDAVIKNLEEWMLAVLNEQPYAGANWDLEHPVVDPPTFCTCDRCINAFRQYAHIADDETITPDTLLAEHRDAWVDFRCMQNAQMAGILRDIVHKADRPVEFSLYSGYQSKRTKEHYGVDWAMMADKLDFAIAGYGGDKASIESTVAALGSTPLMGGEMWYLSHRDDERPAPSMQTWRNRLLRQFVTSSCKGCLIWWLPPMDGGAFYATSEAAEIIAKYEDYFIHEQRCDEKVQVTGIEPRDWAAFEKEGRVLVLLMSFTDKPLPASVVVGGTERSVELAPCGVEVVVVE